MSVLFDYTLPLYVNLKSLGLIRISLWDPQLDQFSQLVSFLDSFHNLIILKKKHLEKTFFHLGRN